MPNLPSNPEQSPAANAAPRLSLGRRLSAALVRTIWADGLVLIFLIVVSLGLALFCTARWEKADLLSRVGALDGRRAELTSAQQEYLSKNGRRGIPGELAEYAASINDLENQLKLDQQAEIKAKEEFKEAQRKREEMKNNLKIANQNAKADEEKKNRNKSEQEILSVLDNVIAAEIKVLGMNQEIKAISSEIEKVKTKHDFLKGVAEQVELADMPGGGDQPAFTSRYQRFFSLFLSCSLLGFVGVYLWEFGKNSSTLA